jgi:hypothetical protein
MKPEGLFNEKYSTSQSIAKSKSGIIDQIIIHLLKVKYGFDEDRDRDKHISDATSWIWDLRNVVLKDNSDADIAQVIRLYLRDKKDKNKFCLSLTREFKKKYGFKGTITPDDVDEAASTVTSGVIRSRRSDVIEFINRTYRSNKMKSYSEVMHERLMRRRLSE